MILSEVSQQRRVCAACRQTGRILLLFLLYNDKNYPKKLFKLFTSWPETFIAEMCHPSETVSISLSLYILSFFQMPIPRICSLKSMLLGNKMATGHAYILPPTLVSNTLVVSLLVHYRHIRLDTWQVFISFSCKAFALNNIRLKERCLTSTGHCWVVLKHESACDLLLKSSC